MKIYSLLNAVNEYQFFQLVHDNDDFKKLICSCKSKAFDWEPPEVFIYKPLLKPGDFFDFWFNGPDFEPTCNRTFANTFRNGGRAVARDISRECLHIIKCFGMC